MNNELVFNDDINSLKTMNEASGISLHQMIQNGKLDEIWLTSESS